MSDHPFNPDLLTEERRRERVDLAAGYVWIHEMTAAEWQQAISACLRPSIDPRGGYDQVGFVKWRIALCARKSDDPSSELVFGLQRMNLIDRLTWREYEELAGAALRVNGATSEEVEGLNDFFARMPVESPSE